VNAVEPNPRCGYFPADRVAVLQGPACASSNESFLKMMNAGGGTLVGATTAGSSGRPLRHGLGRGMVLDLPSWIETWPDGRPTEGVGIPPSIEVEATDARDAVLDRAISLLRQRRSGAGDVAPAGG
jgi:C-terminal processing protease CtpA/Prc